MLKKETLVMASIITVSVFAMAQPAGAVTAGPGRYYYLLCTGSMRPAITCNDTLELQRPADPYNISIGSVVWARISPATRARNGFPREMDYLVHRIVGVVRMKETICPLPAFCLTFRRDYYITKGDANPRTDLDIWGMKINPMTVKFVVGSVKT